MAKYRVTTEDGTYVVTTDDTPSGPPPAPQVGTPEFSDLLSRSRSTLAAQAAKAAAPPEILGLLEQHKGLPSQERVARVAEDLGGLERIGQTWTGQGTPIEQVPVVGGFSRIGRALYTNQNPGFFERGNDLMTGTMEAALPLLPGAVANAPLATGRALLAGGLAQKGVQAGAEKLGVPPAPAEFAGNVAGLATGALAARGMPNRSAARSAISLADKSAKAKTEITTILSPSPKDARFDADFDAAMPYIVKAVGGKDKIASLRDLASAAKEAASIQNKKFIHDFIEPNAHQQVPYDSVGNAIESVVTPEFIEANPSSAKAILADAQRHKGTRTLAQVWRALVLTNNELDALAAQTPGQQRIKIANPEHGWKVAKAKALRDLLYSSLPEQAAYNNQLQGAIGNIRDLAQAATVVAHRTPVRGITLSPVEAAEVASGTMLGRSTRVAEAAARHGIRLYTKGKHPDVLFGKAWKNLLVSVPEDPAAITDPSRMLAAGARQMPPAPDSSYVRGVPTPVAMTSRPLLPSGPTVHTTPPPPDTSYVHGVPAETISQATRGERLLPPPSPESAGESMLRFARGGASATRGRPKLLPPMSPEPGPHGVNVYPGGGAPFAANTATPWQGPGTVEVPIAREMGPMTFEQAVEFYRQWLLQRGQLPAPPSFFMPGQVPPTPPPPPIVYEAGKAESGGKQFFTSEKGAPAPRKGKK